MKNTDPHDIQSQAQKKIANIYQIARQKHPWLAHQNFIGFTIFSVCVLGVFLNSYFYFYGELSAWVVVPLSAIWMSILHELEHDLLHGLYFNKNRTIHHLMLLGGYLLRPTTINPWLRRKVHIRHHRLSGTAADLEERAITNGERWGVRRFLMLTDNMLTMLLRPMAIFREVNRLYRLGEITQQDIRNFIAIALLGYAPIGIAVHLLWYFFVLYYVAAAITSLFDIHLVLTVEDIAWVNLLVVTLIAPNILRTFCLQFVSSNIHYYGDIGCGDLRKQCQVLDVWWLWPVQVFCFNFGKTHAIHHFCPQEPFYLREMRSAQACEVLKQAGVRFNDIDSFFRANRYALETRNK
ncbi:MAG: fatty acid desaturase [Gammaproteobacteria bacterium]|nr:fatty acid desaturase [Gammaproteobacteria bacterium]